MLTRKNGRKQYATATTAASYLSSQDRRVFFGLGKDAGVESIEIEWPSGGKQRLRELEVNRIVRVEEQR